MMSTLTIFFTYLLIIPTVIAFKPSTIQNKLCTSRSSIFRTKLNSVESISVYEELQIPTLLGIYLVDITPDVKRIVLVRHICMSKGVYYMHLIYVYIDGSLCRLYMYLILKIVIITVLITKNDDSNDF
jgi:hypothetical protein